MGYPVLSCSSTSISKSGVTKKAVDRGDDLENGEFGNSARSRLVAQTSVHRGDRDRRPLIALAVVIVVFLVLESVIAIRTPAYESADETGHVQNIESLVSGHWYGMDAPCHLNPQIGLLQCSGDEAQQAPLYYLLFAGWQMVVHQPALSPFNQRHVTVNPAFFRGTSGIFLHHSDADLRFLLWLRFPNIILGALTILISFYAIRLASIDPWTPLVGASFIAFLPRIMFLWPFVTNDNLVDFLGAVFVYLAIRYALEPNGWRIAALGSVFGLLVLTKLSTLPIALALIGLACMAAGWKRRAAFLGIGFLTALMVSGWYFVQNTVRYGDPLARRVTAHYLAKIGGLGTPIGVPYRISDPVKFVVIQVPQRIVETFWYVSGWNQFHWSWPITTFLTLVLLAALLGLIHRKVDRRILSVLALITLTALLSVWGVALQSYYQARYAYVGLTALAALMALGVERWKLPVRFILPAMALIGTLIAIQQDVLAIHWN